jgi:hypothetical protein
MNKKYSLTVVLGCFQIFFNFKKDEPSPTNNSAANGGSHTTLSGSNTSTISGINNTSGNNTILGTNSSTSGLNTSTGINNSNGEILTYTNITFGGISNASILGAYYSTKNNKVYKTQELTDEISKDIDFIYVGNDGGSAFFESPHKSVTNWGLKNVYNGQNTATFNINPNSGFQFSVAEFDTLSNDNALKKLSMVYDNESFSVSVLPQIVVFKSSKIGVIKVKSGVNNANGYVICDIKVQK